MTPRGGCEVCGQVPRVFWMLGGGYWHRTFGEDLCPGCWFWVVWKVALPELREARWQ